MTYSSKFHIEVAGKLATLYLVADILTAAPLIAACDGLPPAVELLRLDLDGVSRLGARELQLISEVRSHWQSTRGGAFRVTFAVRSHNDTTYEARIGM